MLALLAAPAMVAASTLACRRWGAQIGGLLSAFPAVVGPVLLIAVMQRGERYTVRVATGTLLGLVALSGFVLVYATVARHAQWRTSLTAGRGGAAVLAALMGFVGDGVGVPVAFAVAAIALGSARLAMPEAVGNQNESARPAGAAGDLTMRMIVTALLVVMTTAAEGLLGPLVGGMLAGLPILASVLAIFTHRRDGPAALVDLLRGMLTGMAGFVGFCVAVALLIVPAGTVVAFVLATLIAVSVQLVSVKGAESRGGRSSQVWTESARRVSVEGLCTAGALQQVSHDGVYPGDVVCPTLHAGPAAAVQKLG